jgi:hypothetical protein
MVVLLLVVVAVVALAAFVAGYGLALRRARRTPSEIVAPVRLSEELTAPTPDAEPAPEPARIAFTQDAREGTPEWRLAMADIGDRMRRSGTRLVVFAHGSFVGNDPLSVARVVEAAAPVLPEIARAVRDFTRANVSRVLGDLSNFTPEYVAAFREATGVDAIELTWSGENHHAGRIQGAARLARALVLHGGGALRAGDRVLLVGHSHGGQLFALLSQLIARSNGYEELLAAAHARGEDMSALEEHLAVLRQCAFDVATFGTPPRYGWARSVRFRILHVVNHRGAAPRAHSLRGFLHTRHGDYVHHIGATGSDFPAATAGDRALNVRLDRVLGPGGGVRAWLRHVAAGLRVSPHGHTVLVDYGDGAGKVPNFWATGFGHAAYTRREAMLFHARLLANHFYPTADAPWTERVRGWIAPRRPLLPPRREGSTPDA